MGNFDKYFLQQKGTPTSTASSSGLSKYFTGPSSPISAASVPSMTPQPIPDTPLADLVPHINSADVNRQNPLAVAGSMIANIPHEAATAVGNIASVPGAIYDTVADTNVQTHPLASAGGFAKGVYNATLAPVVGGLGTLGNSLAGGVFKGIQNLSGLKLANPDQQKAWDEKYNNAYNAVDGLTKFMIDNPVASAAIAGNTVKGAANQMRPADAAPVTDGISTIAKPVTAATTYIAKPLIDARNKSINASRVTDLNNIISGYAKGRTFLDNAKPAEIQALDNIANRTNLEGTVSTDGRLNLTQVMKDYQANTVDKYSSTVRDTLIREGQSVPVETVKAQLIKAMDDARVAGNQKAAWESSIKKLTKNLEQDADAQGNIPLSKVHDAKIGEAKTANYAKRQGNSNVEIKRKAIAHSLKTVIEDNSAENIKVLNHQLEQYYTDLDVLELLNGKLVAGGKLGKYFAQVSGNIIGASIGSAVGGPIGMAFGSAFGGEAAATMKGRQRKATFGRSTNNVIPPNSILEKAKTANSTAPSIKPEAKPTLALPSSGQTATKAISLPARTVSSIDKAERQNPNIKQPTREEKPIDVTIQHDYFRSVAANNLKDKLSYAQGYLSDTMEGTVTRGSSYPKWVPKHLRDRHIIGPVMEHILNGTKPAASAHLQLELYDILNSYVDDLAGELVKQSTDNQTIHPSNEPF